MIYTSKNLLNIDDAKDYLSKTFGFEVDLKVCKNKNKGLYQIYNLKEKFELESKKPDFPFNEFYSWDVALQWIENTSHFVISEENRFFNFDFTKDFYEAFMKDEICIIK